MLHEITHPNKLIAKKVAFFADYFRFAADTIGINDNISLDNPLSLIEKIVIQIESNPTFIAMCAAFGIEKWEVSMDKMTCTYYAKAGNKILVEVIPQ